MRTNFYANERRGKKTAGNDPQVERAFCNGLFKKGEKVETIHMQLMRSCLISKTLTPKP